MCGECLRLILKRWPLSFAVMARTDDSEERSEAERSWPAHIDASLARGFVRQETRQITAAQERVRGIPQELEKMIVSRFVGRRRLSAADLKTFAGQIDRKLSGAFNSVFCSMTHRTLSRHRPNSVRYDIVHYIIVAEEQPPINGRAPRDRTMRLCVFSAALDQREVVMSLRPTPVCFYEHGARQYLVRGGEEYDAAVHCVERNGNG